MGSSGPGVVECGSDDSSNIDQFLHVEKRVAQRLPGGRAGLRRELQAGHSVERSQAGIHFGLGGCPGEGFQVHLTNAPGRGLIPGGFLQSPGPPAGLFVEEGMIHQGQGLGRNVGNVPPPHRGEGLGRIEGQEQGGQKVSPGGQVDAAASVPVQGPQSLGSASKQDHFRCDNGPRLTCGC